MTETGQVVEDKAGWLPCPACASERGQPQGIGQAMVVLLCAAGCMMWIPVIGWVTIPFLLLAMLVLPFLGTIPFKCGACKHVWWAAKPTRAS